MKRLKQFFSAFIALAICAATIFAVALGDEENILADEADVLVKLATDATEAGAGDTLTVTLSIEKNPGVAGYSIKFNYDKDVLSLVSTSMPEDSAYDSAIIFPDKELLEEGTDLNVAADGTVGISYAEIKNKNKTGNILVATFKVKENAPVGKSKLTYIATEASNAAGNTLTISGTEGEFKVKCSHTKTTDKTTKEPTCTEAGKKETICDICGETVKTEEIAALGHDYGEYVVTKEPTCTEKGEKTATCKRCGDKKTEEIAALGHDYGEYVVTKEPTCTEKGEKTATCKRCDDKKTEEIEALGHKFDKYVVTKEPTCTEKGEKEAECTVCGAKSVEEIPALGHQYEKIEVIKNDEGEEVIQKTCSVCDETVVTKIPKVEEDDFALTDINGKDSKKQYVVGENAQLQAPVYNMYEGEAEYGDVRYVPVAYSVNGKTSKFKDDSYAIELNTEIEGEYKIIVEYAREIYQTEGWVAGDETYLFDTVINVVKKDTNEQDNKAGNKENVTDGNNSNDSAGSKTDNNSGNNGGNNSANSNGSNSTAPKTGDNAELVFMLIMLMMTSVAVVVFERNKRKEI